MAHVQTDWNATVGEAVILNKPSVLTNPATVDLDMDGHAIINVPTPVNDMDGANKAYVNTFVTGLSPKTAVRVATTTVLPTVIYNNGAFGVGATLTAVGLGALVVDGVSLVFGDDLLVHNQVDPIQNGIFTMTTEGTGGVLFILTRRADADTGAKLVSAYTYTGSEGATLANKGFVQATPATITIGTDPIVWNLFNSNTYSDGTGITIGAGNLIYSNLSTGIPGPGNVGQPVRGGTTSEGALTIVGSTSTDPRTTTAPAIIANSAGPLGGTNTAQVHMSVPVTVAQSGTAGYTALKVAVTETSLGSGPKLLVNLLAGAAGTTSKLSVDNSGNVNISEAANLVLGTATGTKIGTSTSQKLGFFNSTPIVKPSGNIATALQNLGLVSSTTVVPTSYTGLVETIAFEDSGSSLVTQTYTLDLYATYGYTINALNIISGSGTCTVAIKINGTNVTSLSAVSVTNTISNTTATGANTVNAGDKVTLVTTSNAALSNLQATIKITRL